MSTGWVKIVLTEPRYRARLLLPLSCGCVESRNQWRKPQVVRFPDYMAAYEDKTSIWHRWFAWHPVRFNGEYRWLCYVERKATWVEDGDGTRAAIWNYR